MSILDQATLSEPTHQLNLVSRNLQEFIGEIKIQEYIKKNGTFSLYWGTAPTGRPHIAYFTPMTKIADFLKAGCDVTILFANLHAYLDNMKAPWELLQKRTEYYEVLIKGMLKALQVPLEKLRFVCGTDYQLKENYTASVYQIIGITSAHDAGKAGCEVVKQTSDPLISGMVYPLLQALDEEFLGVDAQFGGVDQRKIFTYAEKYLPNLGFAKRAHLMNPMIPGLTGGKMSASEDDSKIDLLDNHENVIRKLKSANCAGDTTSSNGILAFIKYVLLPAKTQLNIELLNKYDSIEELESDFSSNVVDETILKEIVENGLRKLMCNLAEEFVLSGKPNLDSEAYPTELYVSISEPSTQYKTMADFSSHLNSLKQLFPTLSHVSVDQFPHISNKPSIMWSCKASGEPHIGYLVPLRKLADLSTMDWTITILIEDIGAHLYSQHNLNKPSWDLLKPRAALYRQFIQSAFTVFGGNLSNLNLVSGSEFQLSKDYALLLYQSFSRMTKSECEGMIKKIVGDQSEIVSNLSAVVYPVLSVLDQLHLGATVRLFGEHAYINHFHSFANDLTNRLQKPDSLPVFVTHSMILSLGGNGTMKSPRINAKTAPKDISSISMCDSSDSMTKKMKKAFFDPKNLDNDPSLNIISEIIWPALGNNVAFIVQRTQENGGDFHFTSLGDIRQQLLDDLMHPGDVKMALVQYLAKLIIEPVHKMVTPDTSTLTNAAFPPEPKKLKINKKAFNPNMIDIRVATVRSITFCHGSYDVKFQCGLHKFSMNKSHCYSLTPNDRCLVAVLPSSSFSDIKIVGVLCKRSSNDTKPVPLRLINKEYLDIVFFNGHEAISPHFKESKEQMIVEQIEKNCSIKLGKFQWAVDGSFARQLEFLEDVTELAVDKSMNN